MHPRTRNPLEQFWSNISNSILLIQTPHHLICKFSVVLQFSLQLTMPRLDPRLHER